MNYSCHVPLSMEFPRQAYWSGLPFPSLGDIPNPGTKPVSPALQVDALPLSHLGRPVKSLLDCKDCFFFFFIKLSLSLRHQTEIFYQGSQKCHSEQQFSLFKIILTFLFFSSIFREKKAKLDLQLNNINLH